MLPIAVVAIVLAIAPQLYDNMAFLTTMVTYVILAEGVNIIYGYTGYLPFGYVGLFGAGAYASSLAISYWHVSGIVAIVIGGVLAMLIGLLLTPLLRLSGAYFALATLAASQTLYYIITNESWTYGQSGMALPQLFTADQMYTVAVVIAVIAVMLVVYVRESHFGLSLRAIRSDSVSASMAGVNVVRERTIAWLISAMLAGLAGAVWAIMTAAFYATSPFDLTVSLYALVFALFGGVRTVLGPVFGAIVLYSVYQYIGISNPQYFELVYGLLIVLLVLFLPGGLSSLSGYVMKRRTWPHLKFGQPRGRVDPVLKVSEPAQAPSGAGELGQ